jgi:DNA-damage-inducible protein J
MSSVKSETLHIRIEPKVKQDVEITLNQLGLSTSEAIKIFLNQIILTGSLPFAIKIPNFNIDTHKAMLEADKILDSKTHRFNNANEMLKDLGI